LAANIKTFVPEGFGLMFCLCSEDSFPSFVVAAIVTSPRSVGRSIAGEDELASDVADSRPLVPVPINSQQARPGSSGSTPTPTTMRSSWNWGRSPLPDLRILAEPFVIGKTSSGTLP
jgi:hypothetical protein